MFTLKEFLELYFRNIKSVIKFPKVITSISQVYSFVYQPCSCDGIMSDLATPKIAGRQ